VLARGVTDGPDADMDHMRQVILGALAAARQRVRIVTPYFLPDEVVLSTLQTTALRGVAVDIVLPVRSNLPLLDWAMRPQFDELLAAGCRIYLTPAPFDHAKLLVVDGAWALIGSTNWDARSLRLNFEYNLECHDGELVRKLRSVDRHPHRPRHAARCRHAGRPAPARAAAQSGRMAAVALPLIAIE
jgi:cardiolipin synthase